jgi:UDP-N-acetyl-D-glucosamine dehydrogenase
VQKIIQGLNQKRRSIKGASVLVLGVAFKPNVDDARNSPAERVIELLLREGAKVSYHDPHVPYFQVGGDVFLRDGAHLESVSITPETLAQVDCVVIVTGHTEVDYDQVVEHARLVIDTVNATRQVRNKRDKIIRLGGLN